MTTRAPFYEYRHLTQEQRDLLLRYRQQQGLPWHAPPHRIRETRHYLFTAANFEHRPIMSSEERRLSFQSSLLQQLGSAGISVEAWVVLPNHYHLLAFVPDFDTVAPFFQRLQGSTSRQWNLEDGAEGRKVWYRYTDRAMRSERHFYTTINYLHYNPVKHGYAERADQWVSSSIWAYHRHKGA
jgi:putative transposase